MTENRKLLIVAHAPSPNTQKMVDAILNGASNDEIQGVATTHIPPLQAGPEDVLGADAIILGTTENLGYMSGALKDFFDRIYYPCLEKTRGMPCVLVIRAGHDGTGTRRAVESILTGLRWRQIQPVLLCKGDFQPKFLDQCEAVGMAVAASLEAGII